MLIGMMFFSVLAFAQQRTNPELVKNATPKNNALTSDFDEPYSEAPKFKSKAVGDTIWYTTLDSISALDWTINNVNSGTNNFEWQWSKTITNGRFTGGLLPIGSSTSSDGFFMLPSDAYNSPAGNTPMETSVTSPWIKISPRRASVLLQFQWYGLFCCGPNDLKVVEVTNDGTNWVRIDATNGLPNNVPNVGNGGAGLAELNISQAAGNADSIRIRFNDSNIVAYQHMYDDIALVEGPANDLTLNTDYLQFHFFSYGINPFYNQIPYDLFPFLPFSANVINNGSNVATNAGFNVTVEHTADRFGNPVNNVVYDVTSLADGDTLAPFPTSANYLSDTPYFVPLVNGSFRVDFSAVSDSAFEVPGDEAVSRVFTTTDTVFAIDDGGFGGGTSPQGFVDGMGVNGGNDFDAMATMYIVESRTNAATIPTSITYYVSTDTMNFGVGIIPTVWSFDETQATLALAWDHLNNVVADGSVYTVQRTDTNSFLTLPVSLVSPLTRLDSGQYMVGWETVSGGKPNGIRYFEVANDNTTSLRQAPVSTLIYLEHDQVSPYGTVGTQPVIRLNIGAAPLQTSVGTINTSANLFQVIPNPSNGEVKINISVDNQAVYNLNVRNILGQTVYTDILSVNGAKTERLDLSSMEKGVYFLTLENDNERLQKKLILK